MERPPAVFPKSARLLRRADFQRVYQQGRRQFSGHMTMFFLARPEGKGGPRVGLTVSRALGGSVERNRIKRRVREAIRRQMHGLKAPVDLVINPKKSVLQADFAQLEQEVGKAFAAVARSLESKKR